jgi:predicted aldo/keto reductase-like oxidoreductase
MGDPQHRSTKRAWDPGVTRRRFLELSVAGAVAARAAGLQAAPGAEETRVNGIPYRTLGRTGEKVSLVGLGGFHLGHQHDERESISIIRTAIDSGINFMDNCWDYNDGKSEERMGKALRDGYRQKVFLMTKIDGRTRQSAARQLDESLRRLQTDHLDLLQFHETIRMTDPDHVFAPGGALEAVLAAKQAGKVRYIGFTGHKSPDIHLHMLETAAAHGFAFDTVQMPLNVVDAHAEGFVKRVLPAAVARRIGVLGMKPLTGEGKILDRVTPFEALHFAMNLPVSVVITGCDSVAIVRQAVDAAKSFRPWSDAQVAAVLAKSAPLAREAKKYELYKHSEHFDSTAKHPEWLGLG